MRAVVRVWSGVAVLLALTLVPTVFAQSEALRSAIDLFDKQEYVAAQEALLKIDRTTLSAPEQTRYDELLGRLPDAIKAAEKAQQNLADADRAYDSGQWDVADRNYAAVLDNPFAPAAGHDYAVQQRARIAEKRRLADAAKPAGPVEETTVVQTTEVETVQEQPAAAGPPPAAAPAPEEGPRRLTPTDELRIKEDLLWQRALVKAQEFGVKARAAITAGDFVEARKMADNALQTIEAAGRYAEPVSKYEAAREEARRLKKEVEEAEAANSRATAARERDEIAKRVGDRERVIREQKQESIQQLFNSAEQLRRERRFGEAAEALRQILLLDPSNAKARYQLEVTEDYESFNSQLEWQRDYGVEGRRALENADQALIPWDYDVLYPKNWLELTARRKAKGVQSGTNPQDAELNAKLNETLPEIRFEEQPFAQVIDWLVEYTKLNIAVDWTDLDDTLLTATRDKPVTIKLSNLPLKTVLKQILSDVGGETQLAYSVGDGLLRIATKDKLNKNKYTLIYDIRDLLTNIPRSGLPNYQQSQGLQAGGQGGGSSNIFGQQQSQQQQQQNTDVILINQIRDIIRQTVEPDSWVETGAGPGGGSIQELNGQLLIYNTSDAHRQVVDLLTQLRETQALQISVESRFLDVTANFLEQFGVDLDFVFNSGTAGYDQAYNVTDPVTGAAVLIPRQYSRIGAVPATPPYGSAMTQGAVPQPYTNAALVPQNSGGVFPRIDEMTPISVQQNSMSLVDPTTINTQVPGSWSQRGGLQPALSIAGSFLDNLQVDFLIRATQANSRSSIVQAPRAVLQNNQAVEIRIESVRTYVASLEPVVGENAALARPVTNQANAGVSMFVNGTISADRRYTTLTIAMLQQGEPSFEKYELQRGTGNSPSAFISLPRFSRTTFTTTVTVPDGGTVLLGGLKQCAEVEVEAGVPILSKIPVLKRAFTNQTTVKDTRTLLILVKSKILIQREAEDEAFPTFTRTGT